MNDPSVEQRLEALQARLATLERRRNLSVLAAAVVVVAGLALAQPTGLITFAADTPARSSEVNDNFTYLNNRITTLDTRVTTVNSALTTSLSERLPAGTIAFFAATTCPTTWQVYGPLRGRTVVGLPSTGAVTSVGGVLDGGFPLHAHEWARFDLQNDWYSWNITGGIQRIIDWNDGMDSAGSGEYPLSVNAGLPLNWFTATVETGMPYVQLLPCQKL